MAFSESGSINSEEFKIGDVVYLKSGSIPLTITELSKVNELNQIPTCTLFGFFSSPNGEIKTITIQGVDLMAFTKEKTSIK